MTFDYKAMTARLSQTFAAAAEAPDLLPRLRFEESMADRHGEATFGLRVLQVLEDNVPGIAPATLAVALVAGNPTSMMRDSGMIERMTPATRALYIQSRQNPGITSQTPPELVQIAMAIGLVNMEMAAEARQKQYIPYNGLAGLSRQINSTLYALPPGGTGAPQLEQKFRAAAEQLQQDVQNFFDAKPKPAAPKAP